MAAKRRNAPKWRVRQRVRKALKKYVRKGNSAGRRQLKKLTARGQSLHGMSSRTAKKVMKRRKEILKHPERFPSMFAPYDNPARVKGRKVKGGRSVTLHNFTGTVVRKSDGRVEILGKGRRN